MFDEIRQAFRELLHGNVTPEGRRELISVMKDTLVQARLAMDDLRDSVEATRKRVEREKADLDTVRRRKGLAQGVGDAETVKVAERFEAQHAERVAVLEQKLVAQESELALVERDVAEMKEQLKAALAGVGSGMRSGTIDAMTDPLDDGRAGLEQEILQAVSVLGEAHVLAVIAIGAVGHRDRRRIRSNCSRRSPHRRLMTVNLPSFGGFEAATAADSADVRARSNAPWHHTQSARS